MTTRGTVENAGQVQVERLATIERLCGELERESDPTSLLRARALVQAVLELHADGLARVLDAVGLDAASVLAEDPTVAGLLLLHGQHPQPIEERALVAVAGLDGAAQLAGVADGVVRVRCTAGMRAAVEAALGEAVPDALLLEIEELAPPVVFAPVERQRAPAPGGEEQAP